MAIDFAKGIATQVVNTGLRKVAGNLPGLLGINKGKTGRDSSDTAPLNQKGKASPNLFQFPLDVAGDPGVGNHGHYIIFFINEQANSKLSFSGKSKSGSKTIKKEQANREIPNFIKKNFGGKTGYQKQKNVEGEDQLISKGTPDGKPLSQGFNLLDRTRKDLGTEQATKEEIEGGQVVKIERPATRRLDTAIAMYMPSSVQVTYGTKYVDDAIGGLAAAAASIYKGVKAGESPGEALIEQLPNIADDFKKKGLNVVTGIIDGLGITSGSREAIEISTGAVVADRMELAFKNVDRRSFQYTFKMIPKNSREADEIRKIVFAFKSNMLPEMLNGRDRDTMTVPNTFNIQYMYKGKENDYVHRISECFLDNVGVTYGGDRYKTFEPHADDGAPPVETAITLSFKEIEIITRERVFEGY